MLFVKKEDWEGTDFYFMGDVSIIPDSIEQGYMPQSKHPVVHFKFQLQEPVISSLFHYITSENIQHQNKPLKILKVKGKTPGEQVTNEKEKLINPIPLYDFYAAAGSFSEMQSENSFVEIEGPKGSSGKGYFACKIIGESMNRVIPNGSICLFKPYTGGTRNGKIVLVENRNIQDPDFNSAFTIKTYSSEKSVSEDSWGHESIVLSPNSFDSSYKNITITKENASEMRIVGEFLEVLKK